MVDSVEIKTEPTTSEKPVEEKQSTQSVEGLPEKFKSVEDLAKSYSELEKKLGEQTPQQEEVDPINATKLKGEESKPEVKQDNSLDIAENAVEIVEISEAATVPSLTNSPVFTFCPATETKT